MQHYLEARTNISTAAADLARHLLPRQYLGKTIVVCEKPIVTISVVRKYWLKHARSLQRERASTLNAEKILQLTHDITHMQHMDFTTKPHHDNQRADVFFITPDQLDDITSNCFNLYFLAPPHDPYLGNTLHRLPARALIVDYTNLILPSEFLRPKYELEQLLEPAWQKVEAFFVAQQLDIRVISRHLHSGDRIDEALDVVLNTSSQFMRIADEFLELLCLCQPTHTSSIQQQLYDTLSILSRRVYALTPGTMSQQFAQTFRDEDVALHDIATENWRLTYAM